MVPRELQPLVPSEYASDGRFFGLLGPQWEGRERDRVCACVSVPGMSHEDAIRSVYKLLFGTL